MEVEVADSVISCIAMDLSEGTSMDREVCSGISRKNVR